MTTATDTPFLPFGPLPSGRVAIEASAGTGKTFTLAALATRFLAEQDISPADLLIVTFTRAATAELRSRIRDQMVEAARALATDDLGSSELIRHLAAGDRVRSQRRLEQAVADFDAASISTIHGFATQVRKTLELSSAIDPDAKLLASSEDLIIGACADALAAASVRPFDSADFPSMDVLVQATKKKVACPDLILVPDGTDPDVDAKHILARELVEDALERLAARRLSEGTMGFDDMLIQLRDALSSSDSSAVVAALRSRYKLVLIDEFQDTDRVQWEIFSSLFGRADSGSTLVLVGDPKQAIYRFRGADIAVYLDAIRGESVQGRFTLNTNWRADGACLHALRHFLDGTSYGDPAIGYVDVVPAAINNDRRMLDGSGASRSGLDLRIAPKSTLPEKSDGKIDSDEVDRMVERDLAAHIRDLLEQTTIPASKDSTERRDLAPSDIAVLVTSWSQGYNIQSALWRQGIPAVVAGSGSVLKSDAAGQLRHLLDAMERPGDLRRVRTYALSWFEGWSVEAVASADDKALADLQGRLERWSNRLTDHPVAEVLAQIWRDTGVVARALGLADGDRNVTDLDHVAEILHGCAPQGRSGVAGLVATIDEPPEGEGDAESDADLTARRIESEARTVLITTVWRAKGLEFPVVCVPMLWHGVKSRSALVFTDPVTGERKLDVTRSGEWPDKKSLKKRKDIATREESAERLRMLYVALTRARHHTALWWAGNAFSTNALTRLLFARTAEGVVITEDLDPSGTKASKCKAPADPIAALAPLVAASNGAIVVTPVANRPNPPDQWVARSDGRRVPALEVAPFTRELDRSVSRWSFSSITQHASKDLADPFDPTGSDRGAADESEPNAGVEIELTDSEEPVDGTVDGTPVDGTVDGMVDGTPVDGTIDAPVDGTPVYAPLGVLKAGTAFGTFVHGVLEEVDFEASPLEGAIAESVAKQARRTGLDLETLAPAGLNGPQLLVDGLCAAIHTPLGPLFAGASLAQLQRADRLDELGFDMRIGTEGTHATVRDIGRLVVDHLPDGHLLGPWADALAGGSIYVELSGFLTGSIDLVARVHHDDAPDTFVVADYKTNRLTKRGSTQVTADYRPERMAEGMVEHHYPLQALLYAAALHRYLRWKLPNSTGPTLVSGAAYLFVRGMTGPEVAMTGDGLPNGVFTWELPPGLVVEMSNLLDGRPSRKAAR